MWYGMVKDESIQFRQMPNWSSGDVWNWLQIRQSGWMESKMINKSGGVRLGRVQNRYAGKKCIDRWDKKYL